MTVNEPNLRTDLGRVRRSLGSITKRHVLLGLALLLIAFPVGLGVGVSAYSAIGMGISGVVAGLFAGVTTVALTGFFFSSGFKIGSRS